MGQRTLRAFVPERGELTFGSLGRQTRGESQRWIHRFQQGLVKQLGVQTRHPNALPLEFFAQHTQRVTRSVGANMRGAGQPPQRLIIVGRGQHMGPLQTLQLQSVLK